MKNHRNYYLGLDIGTNSVGYAVTDEQYNLLKFRGESAWGTTIFDAVSSNADRRAFRTARRRLDRRQQRIHLLQELFAEEISKVDPKFFIRLQESSLYREEACDPHTLFADEDFTDREYYENHPTIHHWIVDLMKNDEHHDVRIVYLACAWLVAHRGHFLSNISMENLEKIKDFNVVYDNFIEFFINNGYATPWEEIDAEMRTQIAGILKAKKSITAKNKELIAVLLKGAKPAKLSSEEDEINEDFPFSQEGIIKLLAGGTYELSKLFGKEEYAGLEIKSISLGMDDDKLGSVMADIGDDYELISVMRSIYDWAVLVDVLGEDASVTISEAKVAIYKQHQKDLEMLKSMIRRYKPKKYDEVFRASDKPNYAAYAYHSEERDLKKCKKFKKFKKASVEDFSKYILSILKDIKPAEEDLAVYEEMNERLTLRTFMPKQKNTGNRVIPQQLYQYELQQILAKAAHYIPFLAVKDEDGLSGADKILSIFKFRIPYYVGPLNANSEHAWIERKPGKIYPWNFEKMVDLDASEEAFIKRMTNTCTYLPGEKVVPKESLIYHKFMVLNEINNLRINGQKIETELKQKIYNEVFLSKKKVTRKYLEKYLISNGYLESGKEDALSGIDININSNLIPQIAFARLIENHILNEQEAERIIERASYAEDKLRLSKWIETNYPEINEIDRKYICSLKIKDFGRLSRRFLCELEGGCKETGEVFTIIGALWNTQYNLMEILSGDHFTFLDEIERIRQEYYIENKKSLNERLQEMYLSDAVKRSVYRTLDIVNDVKKAFGAPKKIFVEMTRGANEEQRGQRTESRKQQILNFYEKCRDEDVRDLKAQLEAMGIYAENRLQSEKLFLYYMQLGKCMYTETPIVLEKLGSTEYNVDHIYPQAYVKDDSIINNKVLVLSIANGEKGDTYPIADEIRHARSGFWKSLYHRGLISDEKYKRLSRPTSFTEEEKIGFINRQFTETSQATKAVATILKDKFPETEIVYCKAKLTTDFRQEFKLYKSRTFNELHHAVDAYLNIVTGNVYNMKFTKNFNVRSNYSIKTKTLFTHPVISGGKTIWDGDTMLAKVIETANKNTAHFTQFSYVRKGGLFDQLPVSAAEGLTPLKKGKETEKYGGYNKATITYFMPVKYRIGKKSDIMIVAVELLHGEKILKDEQCAKEYMKIRIKKIQGKDVDEVSFPLGLKPWKVNAMLSLDGFRVCISGSANQGQILIIKSGVQFASDKFWKYYIKKIEIFCEKISKNPKYIYSEEYDKISSETNMKLYALYIDKLQNSIYKKRYNNPVEILAEGEKKFRELSIVEQAKALLNIHQIFGKIAGGCDLSAVGGKSRSAATYISSNMSNWTKYYSDVRIIDSSASGLWEKQSQNLLELL